MIYIVWYVLPSSRVRVTHTDQKPIYDLAGKGVLADHAGARNWNWDWNGIDLSSSSIGYLAILPQAPKSGPGYRHHWIISRRSVSSIRLHPSRENMLMYRHLFTDHAQQLDRISWIPQSGSIQWLPLTGRLDPCLCSRTSTFRSREPTYWSNEEAITCRAVQIKAIHSARCWIVLCRMGIIFPDFLHP